MPPSSAPIVVAYDPLQRDRASVELALQARELTGAPVVLAGVLPLVAVGGRPRPHGIASAQIARARHDLHELATAHGLATRVVNDLSTPLALHALARAERASLIVAGGRGSDGSSVAGLAHGAPCPVAVAPHGFRRVPLYSVAVGFVDSVEGHAALAASHELARRTGARLRVIAAVPPVTSGANSAALRRVLHGRRRAEHEAALRETLARLGHGIALEPEVHVDDPGDVLLRISRDADVIVCGSRSHGPLRSALLGSVSRRLLDGASCPVLVLPRSATRALWDVLSSGDVAGVR